MELTTFFFGMFRAFGRLPREWFDYSKTFPKCDPILAKHHILDQKNNIGSSHRRADFQYKFVPITLSNPKSRRRQNMNHV